MSDVQEYRGLALDGPLKGQILVSDRDNCMEYNKRWLIRLLVGPSPPYKYKYDDGWWVYQGTGSY